MNVIYDLQKKMPEVAGLIEAELCNRAFSFVKNREDWKAPIDTTIHEESVEYTMDFLCYAVRFMTATEAHISREPGGMLRVRAAGYRNGPAGP